MDPDLALTVGLLIAAFSIPSIMSALSDRRAPRASALTVLIAGGLVIYAVREEPGGYSFDRIPDVLVEVAARYLP